MKDFLMQLFAPRRNRYLIAGLILTIIGVLLIPFIIGIPVAGIGFTLFSIGALMSCGEKVASGKKIVDGCKKMFDHAGDSIKKIIHPDRNEGNRS